MEHRTAPPMNVTEQRQDNRGCAIQNMPTQAGPSAPAAEDRARAEGHSVEFEETEHFGCRIIEDNLQLKMRIGQACVSLVLFIGRMRWFIPLRFECFWSCLFVNNGFVYPKHVVSGNKSLQLFLKASFPCVGGIPCWLVDILTKVAFKSEWVHCQDSESLVLDSEIQSPTASFGKS